MYTVINIIIIVQYVIQKNHDKYFIKNNIFDLVMFINAPKHMKFPNFLIFDFTEVVRIYFEKKQEW